MIRLPDGLAHRPPAASDAGTMTDLIAACELDADGVAEIDREDVTALFGRAGYDPARDGLLVFDRARLVGWGDVYMGRAEAHVHPDHRGRGIGAALCLWTEARARDLGAESVGQTVTDANAAAAELLRRGGYEPSWTSWIMEIAFADRPPPAASPPDGVRLRPYHLGPDDDRTYGLIHAAFGEWGDRDSETFDVWAAQSIRHPSFSPELSVLAEDRDEVVGAALCFDYAGADEGWVQQLATKASHRNRGIARGLLVAAFGGFHERGRRRCGLTTDSRTGALGLYERVGMRVRRSYTRFTKELAPTG